MAKRPKGRKLLSRKEIGGHVLRVYVLPDGSRELACDSWPDLSRWFASVPDAINAIDEFERRASGPPLVTDDNAKGVA